TLYDYNLVERNGRSGIYHEISYDAVIRNNTVRGNGHDRARWASGAGIRVANSSNVEVYGNHVEDNGRGIVLSQQDRGRGERGAWETRNVHVRDNTVIMTTGFTGLVQDTGKNAVFTKWNNRFEGNTYFLDKLTARRFSWMNRRTDMRGWRHSGQDTEGRFIAK
ncbi:MAG: right-handed parallel beta-helix repeat-containing protein, partial [Actinomycetota bacterium]|nr:right-handed parallel beta-helix repeat-containing protein [Actinomycetota bacterium]